MVIVAVKAKGALWGANASLLQYLAIGDVYGRPTTVDMTSYFRINANKIPPKSMHHQFSEF